MDAMSAFRTFVTRMPSSVFAFVMASGAISIGAELAGWPPLSIALGVAAGGAWAVLAVLLVARTIVDGRGILIEAADPSRGFGFCTVVAGTAVVGIRCAMAGLTPLAFTLAGVALLLGIVVGYGVPWLIVASDHHLDEPETDAAATAPRPTAPGSTAPGPVASPGSRGPDLVDRVDGLWFVWIVAAQAITILLFKLQPAVPTGASTLVAVAAVACWATGLGLYLVVAGAFALRVLRYGIRAGDLAPSSWVVMGALAISALAGAHVASGAGEFVDAVRAFALALAVLLWGCATALVPALLVLGFWRHVLRGVSAQYTVSLWAMVFPMAVYSTVSLTLGHQIGVPLLGGIGSVGVCVALLSWIIVILDFAVTRFRIRGRA